MPIVIVRLIVRRSSDARASRADNHSVMCYKDLDQHKEDKALYALISILSCVTDTQKVKLGKT
jgi:hypothetical protein